ncbi:hypothetical protein HOLleu_39095 [Holothuria leucospilota]|uniref:Ig-like domain-containing protein n=1 Tax=Holothuria leucospilota TaxID=206669 RepID=A0A9Q1BDW5_HOLLE|nr:hypothetical protein HOLleu_39095 [Holothuria leucospilota]
MSVSPSNVTVREGGSVTLICASNETGVEITWINIPSEKYIVRNYDQTSELTILSFKPNSNEMVLFMCQGSYGGRSVTRNVSLYPALDLQGRKQDYPWQRFLIASAVIFAALVCIVVPIISLLIRYRNKTNDDGATDTKRVTIATLTEKQNVNLSSTTYADTVKPESVETEEIRRVHTLVPTYYHTIVTDDATPVNTISSKPSALYDSCGYLIPHGGKSISHKNGIYQNTDQ